MDGCQGGRNDKESKSIKIDLNSLVCENSYDDLEISLTNVKGIIDVDIDRKAHSVFVDYDPSVITDRQIMDIIAGVGCKVQEF